MSATDTVEQSVSTSLVVSSVPTWRRCLVVLGAAIGLISGFTSLFFITLPFFLKPLSEEFGWSRSEVTSATVLSMLGGAIGAPLAGKLFTRFGPERVIGVSIILFSTMLLSLTVVPQNLVILGALCFLVGFLSSGTTVVGYMSVLPKWFDARLGLALGLAGIGAAIGVVSAPFIANKLIALYGWRGAYGGLAGLAAGAGVIAWLLISVRGHLKGNIGRVTSASEVASDGMELHEALRDWRFWLMIVLVFLTTFSIFGAIVHGASLSTDRGLTAEQAAVVASLAGVGGLVARVLVGALLDWFYAPAIAAIVFLMAATGLFINSSATSFPLIVAGAIFAGFAFGAEGDLIPFIVRRYFGPKAFGVIFGMMYIAYTLGGAMGPIVYGAAFDRTKDYNSIMQITAAACALSAVGVLLLGAYRYRAVEKKRK